MRDGIPEILRMVEVRKVTKFVNDNVVHQHLRKKDQSVVKVEILLCRAAPPTPPLIPDSDALVGKIVVTVPMRYARGDDFARQLFVRAIVRRHCYFLLSSLPPKH